MRKIRGIFPFFPSVLFVLTMMVGVTVRAQVPVDKAPASTTFPSATNPDQQFQAVTIPFRPTRLNGLLSQLSQSVRHLNYRGLFTYEVGGVLDTYKIIHQVNDGIEYERLERLNGKQREVLRSGQKTECLSQGNRLLQSFTGDVKNISQAERFYDLKYAAQKRIAGRESVLIHIQPTDEFRYGYVFGIDTLSGLPLKILIVDEQKRVLERIQFVDLDVGFPYDDTELLPRSNRHVQIDRSGDCDEKQLADSFSWRAGWLPPGFIFSGAHRSGIGDLMLTYTDGLASFSVFIGPNRLLSPVQGRTRVGATLALVTQRIQDGNETSVTVVGEIPAMVAMKVAEDMRHNVVADTGDTQ